ncbi:MAG: hypothetical protein JXA71_03995 [Chitinispirillaceae bacterium]|nr:hypothetical protein [Chitinispirillaceae bacterium]
MISLSIGIFFSVYSRTPSFDVPLGHPVYGYIDILPFPGRVSDISLSGRPFTEEQVCSLLIYAARQGLCRNAGINDFYLRQFSKDPDGRPRRTTPARISVDGFRTYAVPYLTTESAVRDSFFSTNGFSAAGIDSVSRRNEFCNRTGFGARVYAAMGRTLAYVDGVIQTEYSSLTEWVKEDDPHLGRSWAPIGGVPSHLKGMDDFTAYVKFPLPWFDLKLGNDRVSWGHSDSSGLLFSGCGKPFLQMKLDRTIGAMNYTFLLGRLLGDWYGQKRIIYAKHIDYTPRRWLSLGFSDMVVTVDREVEAVYFLPFLPYYFSQHYIGSPDNALMSFDARCMIGSRWAVYGEYLLDDLLNLLGPFRNTSWGDKWAGFFGIKFFNPLPAAYASAVKLEYMQMEPWVYTASSACNPPEYNYPVHYGRELGNCLGPHSRAVTLDLACQFSKKIGGELALRQIWKGSDGGSTAFDWFGSFTAPPGDPDYYEAKKYRFRDLDRNRTLVSARVFTPLNDWLLVNCSGDFALERRPAPVNLFRVGVDVQVNY